MKKSYSKDAPLIRRRRGRIFVPSGVESYTDTEGNTGYRYYDIAIDDLGQDISDEAVQAGLTRQVENMRSKNAGIEIFGVMCSATADDMWGLSSVRPWILAGNSTTYHFSNGNTLALTPDNFVEFEAAWTPFRAGFFNVEEVG